MFLSPRGLYLTNIDVSEEKQKTGRIASLHLGVNNSVCIRCICNLVASEGFNEANLIHAGTN